MLTALLEEYDWLVFEQRLHQTGVAPALKILFKNDVRQIALGSITASQGEAVDTMYQSPYSHPLHHRSPNDHFT